MFGIIDLNFASMTVIYLLLSNKYNLGIAMIIIQDPHKQKAVELSARHPTCKMYSDKKEIQEMTSQVKPNQMYVTEMKTLNEFMNICQNYKRGSSQSVGFIYPGTKWCGQGNIASNYYDLGTFGKEDSCCREHDHCPKTLAPDECLQTICNDSPFTRSHCNCDKEFRQCLQKVGSDTAITLGTIFFNVVQVTCFKEKCNSSYCWEEFETMPPFEVPRKDKHIPGQDIFTLFIRSIKQLLINKFYGLFNQNKHNLW